MISIPISVAVRQFFRRISIVGNHPITDGPVIFAPNHPNQAVDPFLIGTIAGRPVHFLAKSGLFKNAILGRLFRGLNMIPVYRSTDNEDTSKNLSSFSEAINVLTNNKALCIFPEGTSTEERNLLPLKTGIARIAFDAAVKSDWKLDIKIQPISITYLSPRVFQSSVTLTVDLPISILDYKSIHNQDPKVAVQKLTSDLASRLSAITVSVPNLLLQQDIEHITNLFDDDYDLRSRMQEVSVISHLVSEKLPLQTKEIQAQLNDLYKEGYALGYFGVGSESQIKTKPNMISHILVALGSVIHYIPYTLTKITINLLVKDPHNLASIKIGAGAVFYAGWYIFVFALLHTFCSTFTSILLLLLVMLLGDYSNRASEATGVFFRSLISRVINTDKLPYHVRHEQFLLNRESLKKSLLELSEMIRHDFH